MILFSGARNKAVARCLGSPEEAEEEPPKSEVVKRKKKAPPKVQKKGDKEYSQPAMLRTMEARLNCKLQDAVDPYSPQAALSPYPSRHILSI